MKELQSQHLSLVRGFWLSSFTSAWILQPKFTLKTFGLFFPVGGISMFWLPSSGVLEVIHTFMLQFWVGDDAPKTFSYVLYNYEIFKANIIFALAFYIFCFHTFLLWMLLWMLCAPAVFQGDLKSSSTSECFIAAITDYEKIFLLVYDKDFYSHRQFKYFRFKCQTVFSMSSKKQNMMSSVTFDYSQWQNTLLWIYWARSRLYNSLLYFKKILHQLQIFLSSIKLMSISPSVQ